MIFFSSMYSSDSSLSILHFQYYSKSGRCRNWKCLAQISDMVPMITSSISYRNWGSSGLKSRRPLCSERLMTIQELLWNDFFSA